MRLMMFDLFMIEGTEGPYETLGRMLRCAKLCFKKDQNMNFLVFNEAGKRKSLNSFCASLKLYSRLRYRAD